MSMKKNRTTGRKLPVGRILTYIVLIVYAMFVFFPIMTALVTSFIPSQELATNTNFIWWSNNVDWDAYKAVFANDRYLELFGIPGVVLGFFNTMWITLIPLIIGLVVAGLAAFAYSKIDFPHKEGLFRFSIILSSIPLQAFGVIRYVFFSGIGWTGDKGIFALIIPGMFGSIFCMFFLRIFFDGIPDSLIESAQLDGAGFFQCFFKIMVPLGKPAFIARFIFGFVAGYNSYMGPYLYLQGQPKYITLQLYLSQIQSFFPNIGSENIWCAAIILGILPLVVIYLFTQKYFIEGLMVGAVKG